MLILTRKPSESITITAQGEPATSKISGQLKDGTRIEITVLEVKGNQVKIGIQAPRSVTILRDELNQDERKKRLA